MQLLPAMPHGADQVRFLQHGQVLSGRLARHVELPAEPPQRLPVVVTKAVEQRPAVGSASALNTLSTSLITTNIMQAVTCIMSSGWCPRGCGRWVRCLPVGRGRAGGAVAVAPVTRTTEQHVQIGHVVPAVGRCIWIGRPCGEDRDY